MSDKTIYYKGVYALIVQDNHLMTLKKKRGPYKGLLDLPGGGIKSTEKLSSALKRELEEEINLVDFHADHIGDFRHLCPYQGNTFHHVFSLFMVTPSSKYTPYCKDQEEASNLTWIPISPAPSAEKLTPLVKQGLHYLTKT